MATKDVIYTANSPTITPKIWLRSDKGIILNGNNVQQWLDQSGNNYNATQSNSSYQPLYVGNVQGGKPAIRFADTKLLCPINFYVKTMFVVSNWLGTNPFSYTYYGMVNSPETYIILSTPTGTSLYGSTLFGTNVHINGIQTLDFAPLPTHKIYRGETYNNTTTTSLEIGYSTIANANWNGDILEILVFDYNLSSDQTASIESYLRLKYNLY